ncbi:MAG TPA: ATP-binding protein [Polyangiaceae bacterium]
MDGKDERYSRRLLLAFATVALTFVLGTLYENWRTLEIGAQTKTMTRNALPSIEHLAAASDSLRDIEVAAIGYTTIAPERRTAVRAEMEEKWSKIDGDLAAYLALDAYDGERQIYAAIPALLRTVDEAMDRMVAQTDDGNIANAQIVIERDLKAAIERAVDEINRLIAFNTEHVYQSTNRIDTLRERTAETAVVLDGLAVLVAIGAMVWIMRVFRLHTRLLREHGELVERRANELEVFGKRVAHDLLSPLSALTYCLGAFKRASENDPTLQDAMARARTCVHRAQSMVDGIFEFARAGGRPDKRAKADISEAIEQVAEEIKAAEPHDRPDIEIDAPDAGKIACSRGVLVSVLTNLMRNASKYMHDSPMKKIAVRVRSIEGDAMVRIEVEDTGPGIPREMRDAIFEPYVRAEGLTQPGLGLGLATVKRLCSAHGGEVGVKSTIGRGSTFWFTMPRPKDDVIDMDVAPSSSQLTLRRIG